MTSNLKIVEKEFRNSLSTLLSKALQDSSYSLAEVAKMSFIEYNTLVRILNAKFTPSSFIVFKLFTVLGIKISFADFKDLDLLDKTSFSIIY